MHQNVDHRLQRRASSQRLVGQVDDRGVVAGPAGVVDHDVDPAEPLDRGVDDPLAVRALLGVAGDEHRRVAGVHLAQRLAALVLAAAVDDHLRPLAHEGLGDRSTDPTGSPRDGRDLSLQLHRDCPLR